LTEDGKLQGLYLHRGTIQEETRTNIQAPPEIGTHVPNVLAVEVKCLRHCGRCDQPTFFFGDLEII
jgi:uncharacterized protein YuzB (UPF0349 family)